MITKHYARKMVITTKSFSINHVLIVRDKDSSWIKRVVFKMPSKWVQIASFRCSRSWESRSPKLATRIQVNNLKSLSVFISSNDWILEALGKWTHISRDSHYTKHKIDILSQLIYSRGIYWKQLSNISRPQLPWPVTNNVFPYFRSILQFKSQPSSWRTQWAESGDILFFWNYTTSAAR